MSSSLYGHVLSYVWSYWRQKPRTFAVLVTLRLVSSLLDGATPFAAGHLVDTVASAQTRDLGAAFLALTLLLSIVVAFQALRGGLDFVLVRFASAAMARLALDAFARVQRFSSDWHANTFAGATVRKITRGMWAFDNFTDTMIFNLVPALVVIIAISGVFFARWPSLGALVTLEIVAYLALSISLAIAWVGPASQVSQAYDSRLSAYLADTIGANQVVKAFAAEAVKIDVLRVWSTFGKRAPGSLGAEAWPQASRKPAS